MRVPSLESTYNRPTGDSVSFLSIDLKMELLAQKSAPESHRDSKRKQTQALGITIRMTEATTNLCP